ncbi:MAG TPA: class I SAM-dependent methyltransferase [Candidatus Omnitrophota bacterium]|nr:class I SAM-dependent methyltransferase [Candidatus Omnitrophota bacterium]
MLKTGYERGGTQKDIYTQSDVVAVACPLCGSRDPRPVYRERGSLGIVECSSCGLIYVSPRLKEPEKIYWGDADKYFTEARLIFEGTAAHHRDPNYRADLAAIERYKPTGKFLDIGTNMGFFLRNARGRGWTLFGVEPSPSLSEMARKYFGLNVKTAFLETAGFESSFFDVVTMTDVFEHLTEPKKMLAEISRILKPDGIVFIKVPNGLFNMFKLSCARALGKLADYDIFDSYEHVVHYSQRTLGRMLGTCGFKPLRFFIGAPIQLPVWHKYVGQYYQYPSPPGLDRKRQAGRSMFHVLSCMEFWLRLGNIGYLAPNIIVIARKI